MKNLILEDAEFECLVNVLIGYESDNGQGQFDPEYIKMMVKVERLHRESYSNNKVSGTR